MLYSMFIKCILKDWQGVMMKQEKEQFPALVVMITYAIILLMYIFTYSQNSYLLWAFFVVERLLSIQYEAELDQYVANIDVETVSGIKSVAIILFSIISVGIFIYTPFKYPGLFVILLVGEVIDVLLKKLRARIKRK